MPNGWDLRIFLGGSAWVPENDPAVHEAIGHPGTLAAMDATKAAPNPPKEDVSLPEIVLPDAPDTYLGLAWKGRAARRWAIEQNYDGVFIAMADTYIRVNKLFAYKDLVRRAASAQTFPAAASKGYPHPRVPCPHGGFGYYLSRQSCIAIANDPIRHYSEDQNTAFALHAHHIPIFNDNRFRSNNLEFLTFNTISFHLSTKWQKWDPKVIYEMYQKERGAVEKYPDWDGICKRCDGYKFKMGLHGPRCMTCGFHYVAPKR